MKCSVAVTVILIVVVLLNIFSNFGVVGDSKAGSLDVIIGFADIPDVGLILRSGGEVLHVYSIIPAVHASLPVSAVESLRRNPEITYIQGNGMLEESGQIVSWGVERVGAPQAWVQSTGEGVKVAVLDTGVGPNDDLTVHGGYDFVNNDANASDDYGHGTMLAGIIAASSNSIGVVGVAPGAHIYAVKILDSQGHGSVAFAIQGIEWAISNNMQIISMSWTLNDENFALRDALQVAYSRGILLVAASGNDGTSVESPAFYTEVIAVSAIDQNNVLSSFSCVGPKNELTAPGEMIYSTYLNNGLGVGNGTSMAAAFVSGAAALIWAKNPSLTNIQVRHVLDDTAVDLYTSGRDIYYGFGLVNASAAVFATPSDFNVDFSWAPPTPYAGLSLAFDGSASFGQVNGFTTYMWAFGDGTTATFDSPAAMHTYASSGVYSVNLTVSDAFGFGFKNSSVKTVTVCLDNIVPVTVNNYDGLVHPQSFTITLTASDIGSGVAETYYRINGGPVRTVRADGQPFITLEGVNTLEYWSVDYVGNEELPHKTLTDIKLNKTNPPDSTPTPSPPTPSPPPSPTPTTTLTPTPTATPTPSPTPLQTPTPPPTGNPTATPVKTQDPQLTPTATPQETSQTPPIDNGDNGIALLWVAGILVVVSVLGVLLALLRRKHK